MSPAEQLLALEARKVDLGFVGLRPPAADKSLAPLRWECVAHHEVVVVLPTAHPLPPRKANRAQSSQDLFFVAMSEQRHPGSRAWLTSLCQPAGFTPRILQDVELESGIMTSSRKVWG